MPANRPISVRYDPNTFDRNNQPWQTGRQSDWRGGGQYMEPWQYNEAIRQRLVQEGALDEQGRGRRRRGRGGGGARRRRGGGISRGGSAVAPPEATRRVQPVQPPVQPTAQDAAAALTRPRRGFG